MNDKIPIFFAADDKYARYCAVTIISILEHTASPERLEFYILSSDISPDNKQKFKQISADTATKIAIVI
jgi:lipopolysaccharide biosynthesis glycosyltransferase